MGVSSGAFETSVYNVGDEYPNRIRVEWSSSQSVANNTSTIYWSVKAAGGTGSTARFIMAGPITVNMAGINVYSRSDRFELHVGATLGSGSFTLTHNSDGTKSFSAWAEAALYTYAVSSTKYGYSVDLPQIPRASSISVSGNTMGSPMTISISRAASSFTHTITYQFGNKTGTLATQTSNSSVLWTPPLDLATQIPDNTFGYGTIWCTTFSGDTNIGQKSINFTLYVPSDMAPSIKSFVSHIASPKPSKCGMYVKNNSTVQWKASVSGVQGSTIRKCVIDGQNLHYEATHSSTSYSGTSSTLTSYGNKNYTITITDSRGRTASRTGSINIVDYNPPVITSANSFRSNADGSMNSSGTYVTHKITASFYTLSGKNKIKIDVYSRDGGTDSYGNLVSIKNDSNNTINYTYTYPSGSFNTSKIYEFKFDIYDSVGGRDTKYTRVGTKNIPLNIAGNNNSVAIGGFAQNSATGRFDCAWEAHFASAPITDSDRNLKYNIEDISIDVIDKLRPVQYNLINGESDITHYGFIAQDVEQALKESGTTNGKNGIVYYDESADTKERSNYALAYDELIPLLVKKCQELQREINRLKGE